MLEVFGSWLDWKKSQVSAGLDSLAFDAKLNLMNAKDKKGDNKKKFKFPKKKDTYDKKKEKESKSKESETKVEDKPIAKEENKREFNETKMKDIKPEPKKKDAEKVDPKKVDFAEKEHPMDDGGEFDASKEPKEPSKDIIDLKVLDSKNLLNVIYQVCLENAGELLKYTVSDDDNLSKEESEKRNEEFDKILLPLLAKEITGLDDVSGIDLKQLDEDLNNKLDAGALAASIQSAFTMYVSTNTPYGKPLDLTNNSPMEIVEEESAATINDDTTSKVVEGTAKTTEPEETKTNTTAKSSSTRRTNSRRKK